MWDKFKKKVTNLIYEEVEEEEAVQPDTERTSKQKGRREASHRKEQPAKQISRQESPHREERKNVQTKMMYEYPNKDAESFRFPLIPDSQDQASGAQQVGKSRSQRRRDDEAGPLNQPAYMRRRKRSERVVRNRQRNIHTRPIYEQKKLAEELENVPAFKRRQRYKNRLQEEAKVEADSKKIDDVYTTMNKTERRRMSYSKPDELDAVFRRKNRRKRTEQALDKSPYQDKAPHQSDMWQEQVTTFAQSQYDEEIKADDKGVEQSTIIKNQADELTTYEKDEPLTAIDYEEEAVVNLGEDETVADTDAKDMYGDNFPTTSPQLNRDVETVSSDSASFDQAKSIRQTKQTVTESKAEITIPYHLLDDAASEQLDDREWLRQQKQLLQQTLEHFNVDAKIVAVTKGPTVTRIEIQPALGVKVSRIRNLVDDIKLNLAARDIRIEAPIPGKHTVGIEIPNEYPQVVHLQEMLESKAFKEMNSPLTVALGLTIEGDPYFTDINKMPHGLIAGATGSGKSVCINTMILSLLYKSHYEDVKLMMIDPKMVELTQYNGIPHLLTPVITDAKAATVALKWAVDEMERRYELFVEQQVRNIKRYNRKSTEEKLPYIVIIIDELADLMLVSPQEVEDYISRIAQKARAAGIHLILATQRPSVDVITGLIKANIPSRIAFAVSSQVDSRTILDANGAEKLLGKGDMLFVENGMNKQLRLQGPFVSDDEIDRVVHYLRSIAEPDYLFEHDELFLQLEHEEEDELFEEVVEFVLAEERASTSLLQRRFRIGYNRAARLIDSLYDRGIISAQNGSRPRDVLITKAQWEDSLNSH